MPRVRTPRIYWQATKRRVLTMEWIDGVKLTNQVCVGSAQCLTPALLLLNWCVLAVPIHHAVCVLLL
jgi:hypothetical protein